jgi:hypothetical protein
MISFIFDKLAERLAISGNSGSPLCFGIDEFFYYDIDSELLLDIIIFLIK